MSTNNQDEQPVMQAMPTTRNVNEIHEDSLTAGQRIADKTASIIGSWNFIIIQSFIMIVWVILNGVAWFFHFDNYPYVLLNLFLSMEAALSAPVIMMSQNRQSTKDRLTAEQDYQSDVRSEALTREIKHDMASMRVDTKLKFSDQATRLMQISRNVAEQDTALEGLEMQLNSIELHVKEMHKILEQWNNDRDTGEMEKVKA